MLPAIERGWVQDQIHQSAYRWQQEIESGERIVVGVNRFALDEEEPYEPLRVDPAIEVDQTERLAKLRASRDGDAVAAALQAYRGDKMFMEMVDVLDDAILPGP